MNKPAQQKTYFFCGIGGSGMSALAAICAQKGWRILGSDRSRDQGQSPEKFKALESQGIRLFPQDGSGVGPDSGALVISSAVEESIPDIKAARSHNIPVVKRAELLAELFNAAETGIAVAGTSGKSTITGMTAWVLAQAGKDPTVMNGGNMLNFAGPGHTGLPNMRIGKGGIFLAETDESDGSIALYKPAIAVLSNIALDHKGIDELHALFGDFISRAKTAAVLSYDDEAVRGLAGRAKAEVISYSVDNKKADLSAEKIKFRPDGVDFEFTDRVVGKSYPVRLSVPGRHNVSNALACLGIAKAMNILPEKSIVALKGFRGIGRRLQVTGSRNGITVIDDFAHNPDKIAATLKTLKEFPGRLIVIFQPHGYGPLKLMGRQIAASFAESMDGDDLLLMPEAYYAGGTVDRSVTAKDVIEIVKSQGRKAQWFEKRADILPVVLQESGKGDRVIVMGARDDTLTDFAKEILAGL